MPQHEFRLTDSRGRVVTDPYGNNPLVRVERVVASRTANRIGWFSALLPADLPVGLFRDDNIFQLWRAPDGGVLDLWRPYFIRRRRSYFEGGREVLEISGPDCNDILRRRVVAHRPGTSVTEKIDVIDDMMKEIVLEAFADGVNPAPEFGTRENARLIIEADSMSGPMAHVEMPWETLLTSAGGGILPLLHGISAAEEVPVYFDIRPIVSNDEIRFMFVTNVYRPGSDKTGTVMFSLESGNMENPELIEDSSEEINYIYSVGQGEDVDQYVAQVYDEDLVGKSVWGRIEGVHDAANQPDDAVEDAGYSELQYHRPLRSFYADPISTRDSQFGYHWKWGDEVMASYRGRFSAVVESVTLTIEGGREQIDARMEG